MAKVKVKRDSRLLNDGTGVSLELQVHGAWMRVHVKDQQVLMLPADAPESVLVAALEEAERCMADPKQRARLTNRMAEAAVNQQMSRTRLAERNLLRSEAKFCKYCARRMNGTARFEELSQILDEIDKARRDPTLQTAPGGSQKLKEPTFRQMATELLDKGVSMDRLRDLLNEALLESV